MQTYSIEGVKLAACHAGIRYKNRNDLSLIEICEGASVSAVFTKNAFSAAPVVIAKQHLAKRQASQKSYLLINAGNANAGTGTQGVQDAEQSCQLCAQAFGVAKQQVLPFSTGVIGVLLPMQVMAHGVELLRQGDMTVDGWAEVAQAILTTDTREKFFSRQVQINGKPVRITGICKGSGMIKPNMATMLAYVATDASIEQNLLDTLLMQASDVSFNCISVDGDTSTNDACVLIASGKSGVVIDENNQAIFYAALRDLCVKLAQAIVRDGEGATKFIEIVVEGGRNEKECREVAFTIAHSPLVKTAFFASDPNWGRILAAVGRADIEQLDVNKVDIKLGETALIEQGELSASYTEALGQQEMNKQDIQIRVHLNRGEACATVWSCDFSYDYVKINASYRS